MVHGHDRRRQDRDACLRTSQALSSRDGISQVRVHLLQRTGVVSAERHTGLVEGNKYDTSVAAAVVVHKFDMHLPLYRQTDVFGSSGLEHRQKHALPILEVIKKYVDSLTDAEVLPKSDLAGALGYLRNNWDALTTYASHGVLPIDNNRVEQLMRQVALGRKNWLFVANVPSGERAARLMTIVSSAKRHSLDVWKYLKDV